MTVIDLIQQLYGCPIIYINGEEMSNSSSKTSGKSSNTAQSQGVEHSNMVSLFCGIVTKDCMYLLQPHHEHTVQDATMFSPASLSGSYGKVLFVHLSNVPCSEPLPPKGCIVRELIAVRFYHR